MGAAMGKVAGRADGKRVSALVRDRLAGKLRRWPAASSRSKTTSRPSSRAPRTRSCASSRSASAATSSCAATCSPSTATRATSARPRRSSTSSSGLIERGHELAPATIDSVTGALDAGEPRRRSSRTSSGAPQHTDRAEDRQPEALRRLDPPPHDHLRHRPCRHRQDLPRRRVPPSPRSRAATSAGSSSPAPRSRRGSGSASCPATSRPRSTPTCARCSTRSTTCSTPSASTTYLESGVIEVAPLAFMRGRSLNDSFVILDEAQNTSPEQMKMFLTRLGFGSKMVVTGDITQVDLPRDQRSGLIVVSRHPRRGQGHLVRPLRRRGRRPPSARPADRRRLRRARGARPQPRRLIDLSDVPPELTTRAGRARAPAGVE